MKQFFLKFEENLAALFMGGLLFILFLQSPDPLLGKGSIKKEQPPHSSCSLIPKGFHYIYFIPYI